MTIASMLLCLLRFLGCMLECILEFRIKAWAAPLPIHTFVNVSPWFSRYSSFVMTCKYVKFEHKHETNKERRVRKQWHSIAEHWQGWLVQQQLRDGSLTWLHRRGSRFGSWKMRASCSTAPFSMP